MHLSAITLRMNTFLLLCFAVVTCHCENLLSECMQEHNIAPSRVKTITRGGAFTNDEKCFVSCILEKYGLIQGNCTVNYDKGKQLFDYKDASPEENLRKQEAALEAVRHCENELPCDNQCNFAPNLIRCYKKCKFDFGKIPENNL